MVKIIDMAWVADKSLDLYCEKTVKERNIVTDSEKCASKCVFSNVGKIFEDVFNAAIEEFSRKFDYLFIIIPCYPIMRMKHVSMMTRFICKHSDFLSEIGISSSQFLEFFEKFILSKCKMEYATSITDKVFILNGRGVLLHDWKDAIKKRFGSSLVDDSKSFPFDSNPCFINTMEDNMDVFEETDDVLRYKLGEILESLT